MDEMFKLFIFFIKKKNNEQSGGAGRWRVVDQGGLPRLVSSNVFFDNWLTVTQFKSGQGNNIPARGCSNSNYSEINLLMLVNLSSLEISLKSFNQHTSSVFTFVESA